MDNISTPILLDVETVANKQAAEVNKIVAKFTPDFIVKTAEEAQAAVLDLNLIKTIYNKVDEARKSFTRPIDDLKKRFMDLFRPAETELKNAEAIVKRGLLAYQTEERRKAEEIERKARAEAEAMELIGDIEKEVIPPVAQASKLQGVSTSKIWKGRVSNMNALLRHIVETDNFGNLVEINQSALNGLAKSTKGTLAISGVEFYAEESITVR